MITVGLRYMLDDADRIATDLARLWADIATDDDVAGDIGWELRGLAEMAKDLSSRTSNLKNAIREG